MRIDQESNTFPAELSLLILFKMIESIDMTFVSYLFLLLLLSFKSLQLEQILLKITNLFLLNLTIDEFILDRVNS